MVKPLRQSSYEERRMLIDQGHKLLSSINQTIAEDQGAIAVIWHHHAPRAGYTPRPEHEERDGKVYLLKNSWAHDQRLVKPGAAGYYDDVTHFGQEINCLCFGEYLYSLRRLPSDMLTKKGRERMEASIAKR